MKINKYFKIIGLVSLLVSTSCNNQLDVTPENALEVSNAVKEVEDLNALLLGVYGSLRSSGMYRLSFLYLPDLMADNVRVGNGNGGALRREANWNYSSGDDIDTWGDAYVTIFRANALIQAAENFEDSPIKNRFVGQALALRALSHFNLLCWYGQSYDRNSNDLGVPIKTNTEVDYPARNTVKEVYDQIFEDLNAAKTALGNVDSEIQKDSHYFIDQRAVNALLARISLYGKDWQGAVNYATEVINSGIKLASGSSYLDMWQKDTRGENIFSVSFASRDDGRIGNSLLDTSIPGAPSSDFTMTFSAAQLYDEASDIRFQAFVMPNPLNPPGVNPNNDDRFFVSKYAGRDGVPGLNDAKVLRLSEMYLTRAEANANLGNDNAAMADLNELRKNRLSNYQTESLVGSELKDAIQEERRKELIAEGHRWFDLRRNNLGIERGADCRGLTFNCSLIAGNFKFVYPIPQEEIFANTNIIQNEGY